MSRRRSLTGAVTITDVQALADQQGLHGPAGTVASTRRSGGCWPQPTRRCSPRSGWPGRRHETGPGPHRRACDTTPVPSVVTRGGILLVVRCTCEVPLVVGTLTSQQVRNSSYDRPFRAVRAVTDEQHQTATATLGIIPKVPTSPGSTNPSSRSRTAHEVDVSHPTQQLPHE